MPSTWISPAIRWRAAYAAAARQQAEAYRNDMAAELAARGVGLATSRRERLELASLDGRLQLDLGRAEPARTVVRRGPGVAAGDATGAGLTSARSSHAAVGPVGRGAGGACRRRRRRHGAGAGELSPHPPRPRQPAVPARQAGECAPSTRRHSATPGGGSPSWRPRHSAASGRGIPRGRMVSAHGPSAGAASSRGSTARPHRGRQPADGRVSPASSCSTWPASAGGRSRRRAGERAGHRRAPSSPTTRPRWAPCWAGSGGGGGSSAGGRALTRRIGARRFEAENVLLLAEGKCWPVIGWRPWSWRAQRCR